VTLSRRRIAAATGLVALLAAAGVVVAVRASRSGGPPVEVRAAGRAGPDTGGDFEPQPGDRSEPAPAPPSSLSTTTTARPTTTTLRPTTTTAPTTTTTAVACAPAAPVYSLALLRRPDGNGWSGGANPALERTNDGGRTWTAACLPADAVTGAGGIYGIAFTADGRRGWATGGAGGHPVAFRTVDGGDHWLAGALPAGLTGSLGSVAFVDDRQGWTVGSQMGTGPANAAGGYVLATTDGGVTWTAQPSPAPVARLSRIVFADAGHGWAVGVSADGGPAVIATADGGAHWALQTLPAGVTTVHDAGFADALHGWVVGATPAAAGQDTPGAVLTTADGGATWTVQAAPHRELWSLAVVDGSTLFAGGAHSLWSSHDGGATWSEQAFALPALDSVSFTDARHGWVTHSMFSTVCRTDDGGQTWAASDVRPGSQGTAACLPG